MKTYRGLTTGQIKGLTFVVLWMILLVAWGTQARATITPKMAPLEISLGPIDKAGEPVNIFFSLPMVEHDRLKNAGHPEILFSPVQHGTFKWKSQQILVFIPDEGYLKGGDYVSITIKKAVPLAGKKYGLPFEWNNSFYVPYFRMANKIASWPTIKNQPRFVNFLNDFSGRIGRGPVYLLYDQSVTLEQVQNKLEVKDDTGRRMAIRTFRPKNAKMVFDGPVNMDHVIGMQLLEFPPAESHIKVLVPEWAEKDRCSMRSYPLMLQTRFELKKSAMPPNNDFKKAELNSTLGLIFNNPIKLSEFKKYLSITPKPKSIDIGGLYVIGAALKMELEPGTEYRVSLSPQFSDVLGNSLVEPVSITFKARDLTPVLSGPVKPVLLEDSVNRMPVKMCNIEKVTAEIYRFDSIKTFAKALALGNLKSVADYGLELGKPERLIFSYPVLKRNRMAITDLHLPTEPMLACIQLSGTGTGSHGGNNRGGAVLIQVTNMGITAKIFKDSIFTWVTRLDNGTPVKDARVILYNDRLEPVGEAISNKEGIAKLDAKGLANGSGLTQSITLVAEKFMRGGVKDTAVARVVTKELAEPWEFGLKGKIEGAGKLNAAVFSERGAYRPGETVHIKVIAGASRKGTGEEQNSIPLEVRDPRGQQVVQKQLELDEYGSAALDVKLKVAAPVGEYVVRAWEGRRTSSYRFRVEEYRVPTFKINVSSNKKIWRRGKTVKATVKAEYLHGGSLGGRDLTWEVLRRPKRFAPQGFPKYKFAIGDANDFTGRIASGKEKLDGDGKFALQFEAGHPASAGPMTYVVEATVTDVDRQAYAGRLARTVHPAAFYVGVKPPGRQVLGQGEILKIPVVTVSTTGKPISGVKVKVRLERIDFHTTARITSDSRVQMLNREVEVKQTEHWVTTGKSAAICSLKLPAAGVYRVQATAADKSGQTVQTGFQVTVSGNASTAWPRFDLNRIDVVADKTSYRDGDNAYLVVQTPYKNARGLLTVEQDGVLDYRLFTIKNNTPRLLVPIKAKYAPNVFVSVVLLRGREHFRKDATGFETGAPGFKIGYVRLNVVPAEQRLHVKVLPSTAVANPGKKLDIKLKVRDHNGKPVEGQATVMVVDEAVLGLTGYKTPDPVNMLQVEQLLGVRTGTSILDLPHARRERLEKMFPGGDGVKSAALADFPMELRKLFKSTAYWNPNVKIEKNGRGRVTFMLPDNLTTYRVMAVVSDKTRRAGSGERNITVRKPLMIQPVQPRFAYPGDDMEVEALVFNGTGKTERIRLKADFEGLEQLYATETGGTEQIRILAVEPGKTGSFKFKVRIKSNVERGDKNKDAAVIRYAAVMGDHKDGVEVKLPVLEPGTRRTEVASKSVHETGEVAVTIPAERVKGSVKLEVVTSATVLSELKDSIQYLMGYPNGCIEQTTSTAYPLVVLKDLLPEIGVEVNMADLKKFSEAGVKRILSFQTSQGGLSYWPGSSKPHAFATAFGLTALIAAKKRGYDIPDEALKGMGDYLEAALRKGKITERIPHGNMADGDTRALFVMTLGRLGRPQPGYISVLWRNREKMTAFGLSFLAIAVKEMPGDQSLLEPILEEIRKKSIEEEGDAFFKYKRRGGWSMDSPLRSHGSALIAYGVAAGKNHGEITGKLLTGLLKRRRGGFWGNTQENVFGIMGVYNAAKSSRNNEGPNMVLTVNGKRIGLSEMEALSSRVLRLTLTEGDLNLSGGKEKSIAVRLEKKKGPPIFLTVRASYEVPLTENNCMARSSGFEISRRYETMDGKSLEGKAIKLGSLVRVRIRVKTGKDHHYVAIDDKLPAGLEPLNTNLKTTQRVGQGEISMIAQRSQMVLSYMEVRDSRVAFFVDEMLPNEYEFTYIARATTPGRFLRPSGLAEAMYQPELCGTTEIDIIDVD